MGWMDDLKFQEDGLIPVIAQDTQSGEILMFAFANQESLEHTVKSGEMTYWSRSRKKLWKKGEESGNVQKVKALLTDCDKDVILVKIEQIGGAACHTGKRSCFFNEKSGEGWKEVGVQVFDPKKVYGFK
jgi:phosphoribosyl-AMP cyclohydrolase